MEEEVRKEEEREEAVALFSGKKSLVDKPQKIDVAIANLLNEIANLRAENEILADIAAQLKKERDMFKRLYEFEAKMGQSALAALQLTMDRVSMAFSQMIKSTIYTQELAVKYAETSITNQSLVRIIDELRSLLSKYMPRSELERAMDLLDNIMRRIREFQTPLVITEAAKEVKK